VGGSHLVRDRVPQFYAPNDVASGVHAEPARLTRRPVRTTVCGRANVHREGRRFAAALSTVLLGVIFGISTVAAFVVLTTTARSSKDFRPPQNTITPPPTKANPSNGREERRERALTVQCPMIENLLER
jgi:hypothetical protein